MIGRLAASAATLCLLTACTTPPAPTEGTQLNLQPVEGQPDIGTVFTGTVPMLGRQIPLPAGQWSVLTVLSTYDYATGHQSGSIALVQRNGKQLQGLVQAVIADRDVAETGELPVICTSSDMLWNDVREAIPFGPKDCSAIYFERPDLWWGEFLSLPAQSLQAIRNTNITLPNVVIALHLYEEGKGPVLTESIAINPEARGIAPDNYDVRGQSGWTTVALAKDPAKQQLINDLKALAPGLRATLRAQAESPAPLQTR